MQFYGLYNCALFTYYTKVQLIYIYTYTHIYTHMQFNGLYNCALITY